MADPTGAFCAIHPDRGAVATCDHCGTFACPDCIRVDAGRQICRTCIDEGRVQLEVNPWAQRDRLGFVTAWWRTVLAVSTSPGRFFGTLNVDKGIGEAASFAALSLLPALLMGFVFQTAMLAAFGDNLYQLLEPFLSEANLPADVAAELEKAFQVGPGSIVSGFATSVGIGLPLSLFFVVFFGVIQHVILMLVGGDTKGFEATIQAAFYAVGVRFWEVIPLVSVVGVLWMFVVQALGYSAVHKSAGWKGFAAAWGPALTCCCCALAIPLSAGFIVALLGG